MNLTIAFVTARPEPMFGSLVSSLAKQTRPDDVISFIVVDALLDMGRIGKWQDAVKHFWLLDAFDTTGVNCGRPKPTVWQGPHRLTKTDWWAMSNARNTAICLCQTEWLACVDDRLTLGPNWLQGVRDAMAGGYAACGSYEKRWGRELTGEDVRLKHVRENRISTPYACEGNWWFGCSTALPLEWALAINGYDESCDGLGMEDVIFGMHLANAGYPIKFDPRMHVVEDRTPGQLGQIMKREDKGVSPKDKSHALLARLRGRKEAAHTINLRQIREDLAKGLPFPMPQGPHVDWYDGQALGDM